MAKDKDDKTVAMSPMAGALANIGVSAEDLAKDARLGGDMGMSDISIPYLALLQTNSPQVNPDHDKYIEGAIASMLYLTVVEEVYEGRKDGVLIVPCYYERQINEWVDRDEGGGLVRNYPTGDPIMDKARADDKGRMRLPNGHLLVDTAYHYLLVKSPVSNMWHQAIMPCKGTFLKKSRRLNSEISTTKVPGTDMRAPRFLYTYRLRTAKEQKDDNVWNVPDFTRADMVDQALYTAGKSYAQIAAEATLRRPSLESTTDAEIPF